jgi:hypothetical protein
MRKIAICIIAVMTGVVASTIANHKPADVIPIQLPEIRILRTLFVEDTRWQLLKTTGGYVVDDIENPTIILTDCDSDGEQCLRRGDRV